MTTSALPYPPIQPPAYHHPSALLALPPSYDERLTISHQDIKLIDALDRLPLSTSRNPKVITQLTKSPSPFAPPQDLLKEYTPGETIHGTITVINLSHRPISIRSTYITLSGVTTITSNDRVSSYQFLHMTEASSNKTKVLPPQMQSIQSFHFNLPEKTLPDRCSHDIEKHQNIPPTLGHEGYVNSEFKFGVGNGMGGPVYTKDLATDASVEYFVKASVVAENLDILGESKYPARVIPVAGEEILHEEKDLGVLEARILDVLDSKDTLEKTMLPLEDMSDEDEVQLIHLHPYSPKKGRFAIGQVPEPGLLTIIPMASKFKLPYTTAPAIMGYNSISNHEPRSMPIKIHYTPLTSTPPKLEQLVTKLQVSTFTSTSPLPFPVAHETLAQLPDVQSRFAQYKTRISSMPSTKSTERLLRDVDAIATMKVSQESLSVFQPTLFSGDWIKSSHGWSRELSLSTEYVDDMMETLVPSFQNCLVSRVYALEVTMRFKYDDGFTFTIPVEVTKHAL